MNYLGHLLLAHRTATSLAGAVLGDFVRGSDLSAWPAALAEGIRLHRRLDAATDAHPVTTALRAGYPQGERRYAGIVLDVALDHALARDWSAHGAGGFEAFCADAGAAVAAAGPAFRAAGARAPEAAAFAGLLRSYREPAGIDLALRRIADRLRRPDAFLHVARGWPEAAAALAPGLGPLLADLEATAREALAAERTSGG